MNNKEIRVALQQSHMTQWQLGDLLGVSENTVNRKLRKELPEAEKKRILQLIKNASKKER